MNKVQRKYKLIQKQSIKDLTEEVNELIQREYKDTEGFLYRSSGRWQCLGGPVQNQKEFSWVQAMVFIQEEEWMNETLNFSN